MLGIHDFGVFLAACLLLNLTPGQDTLYIVGRSAMLGRAAGIAAALGICAGGLFHALAAALGLSALLATSQAAFTLLKWIGALYLVYIGVTLMVSRPRETRRCMRTADASLRTVFRQGVLTNVTNPKVALFFLAFLPQFVDPHGRHKVGALLVLGLIFVATSTLWCLVLAATAATARRWLRAQGRAATWLARAVGTLFVLLGLRLVLAEH